MADAEPAPRRIRCAGRRAAPRGVRHVSALAIARARGTRTSPTRPGCSSAARSAVARARPSSSSSRPTRPSSGPSATGSPARPRRVPACAAGSRPSTAARARLRPPAGAHPRGPERVAPSARAAWGVRAERITLLPNPVAPPPSCGATSCGRGTASRGRRSCSRAGSRRRSARRRARRARACRRGRRSCSPATGPDEPELRGHAATLGLDGRARSSGRSRAAPCFELLRAADARCSPRAGRTSRTWCRGARGRDTGARDARRRRRGDRARRRERPARADRGPGGARRGDPPLLRGRGPAGAAARSGAVVRRRYAPGASTSELERILERARPREDAPPARRADALPAAARRTPRSSSTRSRTCSTCACSGAPRPGSPTAGIFELVPPFLRALDGAAFHALLPLRRARDPALPADRSLVQGAHEAALALAGDASRAAACRSCSTSTATGGPRRASTARRCATCSTRSRTASPSGRFAASTRVRTVSDFTTGLVRELGVEPVAIFPAFMDLQPFPDRAGAVPRAAARALRRGARALQGARPARGGVAARRGAGPRAELRLIGRGARGPRAQLVERGPTSRGLRPPAGGDRGRARPGNVPRAPVAPRGHGPRRRRGVLPRAPRRRNTWRRDRGPRRGRAHRAPAPARRRAGSRAGARA